MYNRNIKLKKWDNCYTFILKLLNIFDDYKNVESDDFVGLFKKDYNLAEIKDGDIIVCEYIDTESSESFSYRCNELCDGVLLNNRVNEALHFMLVYRDKYILDLSYDTDRRNYIRIRKSCYLETIDKTKWVLYKLILK